MVKETAEQGYSVHAGIEPEFIVMKWEDGQPVKAIDDDPRSGAGIRPRRQAFGYDVEYSIDSMGFLGEMIDIVENLGWDMHDVVCEGAYSQFELDFHYTDVLQMADRFVFLRVILKEIAKRHGMFVTFMPKPTTGDWRSGAHLNTSMRPINEHQVNAILKHIGKILSTGLAQARWPLRCPGSHHLALIPGHTKKTDTGIHRADCFPVRRTVGRTHKGSQPC